MNGDELTDLSADQRAIRDLFGVIPSGVLAVGARVDNVPVGMAVSSFTSVSISPPLLSINIRSESSTWPQLDRAARLGLSLLTAQQATAARQLAGAEQSARFAGVAHTVADSGALFIDGAALMFESEVVDRVVAGDHLMVILHIRRAAVGVAEPLVFHRSAFTSLATV